MESFQDCSYGIIPVKLTNSLMKYFIVRHTYGNHWGFPKGHPETGELPLETAKRELFEETGFIAVRLLGQAQLQESYSFLYKGRLCNKTVNYFLSEVEGDYVPDISEIAEGRWVSYAEAIKLFNFESIRQVIKDAEAFLKKPKSD
ncbi:MAG: NUDIX domain-containing protein [Victivallaceae bacterium]